MLRLSARRPVLAAVLVPVLLALAACEAPEEELTTRRVDVPVGEATVAVVVHEAAEPGLTYINVHDDENTAAEAVLEVVRRHGGRLIELQHTGERNISFPMGDSTYVIDANRIYTPDGAEATLRDLGAYAPAAGEAVAAFAGQLLDAFALDSADVVVTVHNNTDDRYSLLSYMDDGAYATDALFVHKAADWDADDFFFVTDPRFYDAMREAGFNVVLQDNARVTDDGSLSVWAAQQGMPYVNVEAQHGHFEQQVHMLEFLNELLADGPLPAAAGAE